MVETEAITTLPTTVFKEQVQDLTGRLYAFLLNHLWAVLIILFIILTIVIIIKIRFVVLSKNAKKLKPVSTNNWFKWEDFEKWQMESKK